MVNIRRHNPVLRNRMAACLSARDAEGLGTLLAGLSNADFRTAGCLLGEELLPGIEDGTDFWHFFQTIVPAHSRAYLGTFLKGAVELSRQGRLDVMDARLEAFAAQATPIDRRKVLDSLLPVATSLEEVARLLRLFCADGPEAHAAFLLRAGTPLCYYQLFRVLKKLEAEPETLRRYCILLMRKGDHHSFNLAGIICRYFDIGDLPGTFSLHLPPYQQSRLDESFESFYRILNQ